MGWFVFHWAPTMAPSVVVLIRFSLAFAATPAVGHGLLLGAEPALAFGGVDDGRGVELAADNVINLLAGSEADVAFDETVRGRDEAPVRTVDDVAGGRLRDLRWWDCFGGSRFLGWVLLLSDGRRCRWWRWQGHNLWVRWRSWTRGCGYDDDPWRLGGLGVDARFGWWRAGTAGGQECERGN